MKCEAILQRWGILEAPLAHFACFPSLTFKAMMERHSFCANIHRGEESLSIWMTAISLQSAEREGWQILMEPLMPALKWWNCWQDRCLSSDKRLRCYLLRLIRVPRCCESALRGFSTAFSLCGKQQRREDDVKLGWVEQTIQAALANERGTASISPRESRT